jgi:hypothetical protein
MKKSREDPKGDSIFKKLSFGRRSFLKGLTVSAIGGLGGALFRPRSATALGGTNVQEKQGFVVEQTKKIPIIDEVDVLVVGGGMAGVGAAIAAGRKGAKTLLVENYGCLGGTGTSGMVNNFCGYSSSSPGAFQIVKGIGDEVLANLWARGGKYFSNQYHLQSGNSQDGLG